MARYGVSGRAIKSALSGKKKKKKGKKTKSLGKAVQFRRAEGTGEPLRAARMLAGY